MSESHQPIQSTDATDREFDGPIVRDPSAIKRIAVFHLNGVGDLLFSLPALVAIRERFPSSRITSIIRRHLREPLEPLGLADEILPRPRRGDIPAVLSFLRSLRRHRFDLAVLFSQSASANIYALLSGTRIRVGFIDTIFPWLLSHPIPLRGISSTAKLLHLAEQLGAEPQKRDYAGMLKVSDSQRQRANCVLDQAGVNGQSFAVLSITQGPGAMPLYKTWPLDNFAAVGKHFLRKGLVPVVIGTATDVKQTRLLTEKIGQGAVSLAGKTRLDELIAIIQRAKLLVGIDSGPVHIAAALGVPVVALYGPTDPAVTGVRGDGSIIIRKEMPCSPCRKPTCEGRPCMTAITPEEVIAAAEKLIESGAPGEQ
ncbi:MAG: hypothetical protein GTN69_11310 [Armatimonadetes bacterium]|nr:hypothetical protein [Armatimonadota bacterium]NIO76442.1 hypothetical protein [Armatimonadota bacterium]NIO98162.1 hypothetical protein [Armatimonadota bacterium]